MTTKTFTSLSVASTHGTRKAAAAELARREAYGPGSGDTRVTYALEHTGPRLFAVVRTTAVTSEPRPVSHVTDGSKIVCRPCGSELFFYTGRSLYNLNYECAACGHGVSPVSETGACQ